MAARQTTAAGALQRIRLFPPSLGGFFRRRLIEAAGLGFLLLALALLLACLSYDPADPSFNKAVAGPVGNLLGRPGAYTADLLLQSLGLTAPLLALPLLAWGYRLLRERRWRRWWAQLALTPLALLCLAPALSVFEPPQGWPFESGLGGFVGDLLRGRLTLSLALEPWLLTLVGGAAGVLLLAFSLGLSRGEWVSARRGLAWLFGGATRGLGDIARRGAETLDRLPERKAAKPRAAPPAAEPRLERRNAERAEEDERLEIMEPTPPRGDKDRVVAKAARPRSGRKARQDQQPKLDFGAGEDYVTPPLELLDLPPENPVNATVNKDALEKNARLLESVLEDFGVRGEIVSVRPGPVVTRYDLEPAPGTKTSRVVGLADDIARSMSAVSVRVAVVPGSSVIGIELPNIKRDTVFLRELLAADAYDRAGGKLPLVLGKDISGGPQVVDLARMPHLLVAGTTGSGKSVAINAMILSLLYHLSPDRCRFIMVDPKMLELSVYDGIPHLLAPVVTEPKKAVVALKWTVREMEERYRAMSRLGVRNIDGFNSRIEEAKKRGEVLTRKVQTGFDPDTGQPIVEEQPFDLVALPYIVVIVDEMADLMLVAGKDVEAAIQRLAQMARAAGIHLIMATQRPSVDVITGTIKANFPTRVSFHVTSKIDSRTILGEPGAEQLLGQGDMLYMAHGGRITRVHGPLVTDREVEDVVSHLKAQGQPDYVESVTEEEQGEAFDGDFGGGGGSGDELYDRAVALVCRERKASTSFIQRHLQIGYNRAARIIEQMEAEGVVSGANHVGKREVLARNIEED